MKRKTQFGFTILELMMTLVIAGILLAVAVPSYTTMVMNNCLTTKTNALVSALQLARSMAITVREEVSIGAVACRMDENNDGSADGTCTSGDDFGEGIVVYRDLDGDGLADTLIEDLNGNGILDVGEDTNANGVLDMEVIRIVRFGCAATIDETVDGGNDTTADTTQFIYTLKGYAAVRGTFNVCDNRDTGTYVGRQISLSSTGRPATDSAFTGCP